MKKFHVGIKAIIQDPDEGILFLKNVKGFWDIPGGRIDGDENIEETLNRELGEELPGSKLTRINSIAGVNRVHKDIQEDISLVLVYTLSDVELPEHIKLSEEHTEYLWVDKAEGLPDLSWSPNLLEISKKLLK